ncbi:hypothetical protein AAC387_Pa11g0606 [Persea americana]
MHQPRFYLPPNPNPTFSPSQQHWSAVPERVDPPLVRATECYDSYTSQFPVNNLFAAASEGNGPPCGREYLVTYLSAAAPNACIDGQTIQVVIVDYIDGLNSSSSQNGTTMVLSNNAFATMIADQLAAEINIEFQQ